MSDLTLNKIHEDILDLKKEIEHIRSVVDEEFELAEDVINDIKESRNRLKKGFVSHEDMRKEFN